MTGLVPLAVLGDYVLEEAQQTCGRYSVWLASHRASNQEVSLKIYSKAFLAIEGNENYFRQELRCFSASRHPFFSLFVENFETTEFQVIAMSPLKGGTLLEFLASKIKFSEQSARPIFVQLLMAVDFLHSELRMMHGSLSMDCFMLDENNVLRVVDLWGARELTCNSPNYAQFNSVEYQAPEIILGSEYGKEVDIWGLGIITYQLIVGSTPFKDAPKEEIVRANVKYPTIVSNQIQDLLKKMIHLTPKQRITIDAIKQHPWFSVAQYNVLLPFLHQELKFDASVADSIAQFGSIEKLRIDFLGNTNSQLMTMYKIAEALNYSCNLYNAIAKSMTTSSNERRRSIDYGISMGQSRIFTSQPSLQLNLSNEKLKIKPLALQLARPVQIAARRASVLPPIPSIEKKQ